MSLPMIQDIRDTVIKLTYIARRAELNVIAKAYKHGDPLPRIEYTAEERETWRIAYTTLKELRKDFTCSEYQNNIVEMEAAGLLTADRIPSIQAVSDYIQRRTGFQLRPCGGLLSARDSPPLWRFACFKQHATSAIHQSRTTALNPM
uniref:BH4_AAA_HYDROXYL_2 domain-containing protein n=1 Tax=Panagrellus redivivus TaxID=6233 RepID=A0A7E4VHU8_PANRE